jgi:hypothetical protein
MFRTLLICAVVSASVIACSSTGPARPDTTRTATAATARPCPQDTASRIPLRPGECSSSPGRTYSDKDMERTGQTDVGNALQLLDPSITVHH